MPIVAPSSRYTLANNNNNSNNCKSNYDSETAIATATTAETETVKKTNEEPGRPSVWRSHPISDKPQLKLNGKNFFWLLQQSKQPHTQKHTHTHAVAAGRGCQSWNGQTQLWLQTLPSFSSSSGSGSDFICLFQPVNLYARRGVKTF